MDKITSALRRLALSDNEQQVYLSLLRDGQASARVLAARTGITRPSVYDQLKSLHTLGLVNELDIDGKTIFAAADLKYLDALLSDRIDRLSQSRAFLADALPELVDTLKTVEPKIRFFQGEEGVKNLLKDVMWHDHTELSVLWPAGSMAEVFDQAFLRWFDERRELRSLHLRLLITKKSERSLVPFTERLRDDEVRVAAISPAPAMAYLIFGSKVAYISSSQEAFGFIVESNEHASLMRLQFRLLWEGGKKG